MPFEYKQYKSGNPHGKHSVQHAFVYHPKSGYPWTTFSVYDAFGWTDLPWPKTNFVWKVDFKYKNHPVHIEVIFYRWMLRLDVVG